MSPSIINFIKSYYDNKKFFIAAKSELTDLQFRLCISGYYLAQRFGDLNKEYILEVKNIVDQFRGGDNIDGIVTGIEMLLNATEEEFNALVLALRAEEEVSLNLKTHTTILLDSNATQITRLPMELQSKIYEFKNALSIYNQEVLTAREKWHLTYDSSLSEINHQRVSMELSNSYANLQQVCSRVCVKIQKVIDFEL